MSKITYTSNIQDLFKALKKKEDQNSNKIYHFTKYFDILLSKIILENIGGNRGKNYHMSGQITQEEFWILADKINYFYTMLDINNYITNAKQNYKVFLGITLMEEDNTLQKHIIAFVVIVILCLGLGAYMYIQTPKQPSLNQIKDDNLNNQIIDDNEIID